MKYGTMPGCPNRGESPNRDGGTGGAAAAAAWRGQGRAGRLTPVRAAGGPGGRSFYEKVAKEGMAGQELGDAAVFGQK